MEKHKHPSILKMWNRFLAEKKQPQDTPFLAWHFCDDEFNANNLAKLVLEGTKTATSSLYNSYLEENEPFPKVGDYSVIINWVGEAQCIIQNTNTEYFTFLGVPERIAFEEGEGDRTLEYWRRVHKDFFMSYFKEKRLPFDPNCKVVSETFKVVFE